VRFPHPWAVGKFGFVFVPFLFIWKHDLETPKKETRPGGRGGVNEFLGVIRNHPTWGFFVGLFPNET